VHSPGFKSRFTEIEDEDELENEDDWGKLQTSEPVLKKMNQDGLCRNSFLQKAAGFSGVAGEFRCLSLHRSQISKDL
jgi:hypothetical protein